MLRKFVNWWNNPPERIPKKKIEKPLSWRGEMEARRMEIVKEAKAERRSNKRGMDESDGMLLMLFIFILFGFSMFIVWGVADSKDKQTRKDSCESIGGVFEVIDETYAGNTIVNIYGCVK